MIFSIENLYSSSPNSIKVDNTIHVRDKHRYLRLMETGDTKSVGLSFEIAPYTNSEDILAIDDISSKIVENLPRILDKHLILYGQNSFKTQYKNFLLTHKFYESNNVSPTPLFWRHRIYKEDETIDSTTIHLLDRNFVALNTAEWLYEEEMELDSEGNSITVGYLFNNAEAFLDQRTGKYECYYVEFSTKEGNRYVELLNNAPIFQRKTLDNINYSYLYSLTDGTSNLYNISIKYSSPMFAVKPSQQARLYLHQPLTKEIDNSWNLFVNNGAFKKSGSFGGIEGEVFAYQIASHQFYYNQPFTPTPPYKRLSRIRAEVLTRNLIWIPITNIVYNESFHIDIIVKDSKERLKFAYTTDSSKNFYIERGLTSDKVEVIPYTQIANYLSINQKDGFIYLTPYSVELDDIVTVNCHYTETALQFHDLELNPSFNRDILDKTVLVILVPYSYTEKNDLQVNTFWFILNKEGNVESSSDDSNSVCIEITNYINNNSYPEFLYEYTSSGVYFYVPEEEIVLEEYSESIYKYSFTIPPIPTSIDFSNKVIFNEYKETLEEVIDDGDWTVVLDILYVKVNDSSGEDLDGITASYKFEPYNTKQYLLLGEVAVRDVIDPHELSLYDIRTEGGGIIPEKMSDALKKNSEVNWYWDIGKWDGIPVPGMSTEKVDLPWFYIPVNSDTYETPLDLLDDNEVQVLIEKRQALGDFAIKNLWGPDPCLLDYSVTDNTLTLIFSDEDHETGLVRYWVEYKINNSLEEWSEAESCDTLTHSVVIENLVSNTEYLVKLYAETLLDDIWQVSTVGNKYLLTTTNIGS